MTRTLERICELCGAPGGKRASARRQGGGWVYQVRCEACRGVHTTRARHAAAIVHPTKRYADDVACQILVNAHPEGLTLEQVGEALGLSRQRVQQIEAVALSRVRRSLSEPTNVRAEAAR